MRNAISNATSVPGQTELLWKDDENRGWLPNKEYAWNLKFRPLSGDIKLELYEESTLMFDTGLITTSVSFISGRLGIYTYSQPLTSWYNMMYECDDSPLSK